MRCDVMGRVVLPGGGGTRVNEDGKAACLRKKSVPEPVSP